MGPPAAAVTAACCIRRVCGYQPVSQLEGSWPGAKNASRSAASRSASGRAGSPARNGAEFTSGGTLRPDAAASTTADAGHGPGGSGDAAGLGAQDAVAGPGQ